MSGRPDSGVRGWDLLGIVLVVAAVAIAALLIVAVLSVGA